jgi:hypothetical protein
MQMNKFNFYASADKIGAVCEATTDRIEIFIGSEGRAAKVKVGHPVAIDTGNGRWTIGVLERVRKGNQDEDGSTVYVDGEDDGPWQETNTVVVATVTITGTFTEDGYSRSVYDVPQLWAEAFFIDGENMSTLLRSLAPGEETGAAMTIGRYAIDASHGAAIDGNRFFQRHAAILGSTGSGKSWTVASILERANALPSSNIIVFDLHGEYASLDFARHLKIPGPDEAGIDNSKLLYLPFWLMDAVELQSTFVNLTEFTAHNQVSKLNELITESKRTAADTDITLNSPVPFDIAYVLESLKALDGETIDGARGKKNGPYNGQFSRLIPRMEAKITDPRYGFMFRAPEQNHPHGPMTALAEQIIGDSKGQIKIIDFSEVPKEVLPIIVGLVARTVYQIQFWTRKEERAPICFVCDEAHLYLPRREGLNPVEERAIETFERIAKEGRKYGVSLLVVSQRPSDVSQTILSQCNNIITLRLTNQTDQQTVKTYLPDSLKIIVDALPTLDVGECFVVGDAVLLPSRIKLAAPGTKPLSATVEFWDEWAQAREPRDFNKAVGNMIRQGRK